MKRVRSYTHLDPANQADKRSCSLISDIHHAFDGRALDALNQLPAKMKDELSFEECEVLLRKLSMLINNKNTPASRQIINAVLPLKRLAFININRLLGSSIDEWLVLKRAKGIRTGDAISFILFYLGSLADKEDNALIKLPVHHIEGLITRLTQKMLSKPEAHHALFGIGFLMKNHQLEGNLKVGPLVALLEQATNRALDIELITFSIAIFYTGAYAKAKRLDGILSAGLCHQVLDRVVAREEHDPQSLSNIILGLGFLADAGRLDQALDAGKLNAFIGKFDVKKSMRLQSLSSVFYGLGLLAIAKRIGGEIAADRLLPLLDKSQTIMPDRFFDQNKDITQLLYGLGLMAKHKLIEGRVAGSSAPNVLLGFMAEKKEADITSLASCLYSAGLLAREGHLHDVIATKVIDSLLEQACSRKHGDLRPIRNIFWGLSLLASYHGLESSGLSFTNIKGLLQNSLDITCDDSSYYCSIIFSLGFIAAEGCLTQKFTATQLNALLNRVQQKSITVPGAISDALHGLGEIAKSDYLSGDIDVVPINFFLTVASQLSMISFLEINTIFYGLACLAKAGKLQGMIAAKAFEDLLSKLVAMKHIDSQAIATAFYCLGWLIHSKALSGKIAVVSIQNALVKFRSFHEMDSFVDTHQVLHAMTVLVNEHHMLATAICNSEQLEWLMRASMQRPYYHPVDVAEIIHTLVTFKEHSTAIEPLFFEVLGELSVSVECLSPRVQQQFKDSISALSDVPAWQQALIVRFPSLVSEPLGYEEASESISQDSPISRATNAIPAISRANVGSANPRQVSSRTLSIAHHRRETGLRREVPARIPSNFRQGLRPEFASGSERASTWARARDNSIFRAIDDKNINELLKILKLSALAKAALSKIDASRLHRALSYSAAHGAGSGNVEQLIRAFFRCAGAADFRILIAQSKRDYFIALLQACSGHTRYQLARSKALHPVWLYLPLEELAEMMKMLISPFQMYRDHQAALEVIDALAIRFNQSSIGDKQTILRLQRKLAGRATEFHRQAGHRHVLLRLQALSEQFNREQQPVLLDNPRELAVDPRLIPTHSLFEERAVSAAGNTGVHVGYQYEAEDINAILRARFRSYPLVQVLAAAHMDNGAMGNRVADVLTQFFNALAARGCRRYTGALLLPMVKGAHWTGLRLDCQDGIIQGITFYNSLASSADAVFLEDLKQELRCARLISGEAVIKIAAKQIQQPDSTSCGPCLIENFYCDQVCRWWKPSAEATSAELMMDIRQKHLGLLQEAQPDYYRQFKARQHHGSTVAAINTQRQSHGLSSAHASFFAAGSASARGNQTEPGPSAPRH